MTRTNLRDSGNSETLLSTAGPFVSRSRPANQLCPRGEALCRAQRPSLAACPHECPDRGPLAVQASLNYYGTLFWCVGTLWNDFVTQKTAPCPSHFTRTDLCIRGAWLSFRASAFLVGGCFCFLLQVFPQGRFWLHGSCGSLTDRIGELFKWGF